MLSYRAKPHCVLVWQPNKHEVSSEVKSLTLLLILCTALHARHMSHHSVFHGHCHQLERWRGRWRRHHRRLSLAHRAPGESPARPNMQIKTSGWSQHVALPLLAPRKLNVNPTPCAVSSLK
jgi:hypothetical protein